MGRSLDAALTPRQLLERTLDPGWPDGAGQQPWLLIRPGEALTGADLERLLAWARRQPLPLIGVDIDPATRLGQTLDLHTDDADLDTLCEKIGRNPTAAALLVQVLRATEGLAVEDALVVESLGYAALQSGAEFARWLAQRERRPPGGQAGADPLQIERRGDTLEITLNAPARRNALSVAMRDALTEAFRLVAVDEQIAIAHVRGNGPCFSAGGDLDEFGSAGDPSAAHQIRLLRMPARCLAEHARRYHFHLHGACIGAGIELPAFAGRVTARADSYFVLPEVAMGLIPGAGGCVSIPRRIGRQRTAWMAISGEPVPVARALQWGLVDALEDG